MDQGFDRKQVLGVVGSPRRGGNTEILVDRVLLGAKEAGARTEKVILNELEIAPCQGCDMHKKLHRCVQQDDMQALLEQMERSQVWVLGTPLYWWGPSAQFKTFLDRWRGAQQNVVFKGRQVVLVMPMEDPKEAVSCYAVGMLAEVCACLGMELLTTVLAPGVRELGEVRQHPDVLATAQRAGWDAVTREPSQEPDDEKEPVVVCESEASDEETAWVEDLTQMDEPRFIVARAPIPLPGKRDVLIGRSHPQATSVPDIDLVPHGADETGVSRRHAKVLHDDEGWALEDLGSTNGTFLNGEQLSAGQLVRLHRGDIVRLGQLTLIYCE
jgi:NAD(P)H-dependent FMN reductase